MKQGISPAVAIVVILIVVVLAAAIGYFMFIKPKGGGSEDGDGTLPMGPDAVMGKSAGSEMGSGAPPPESP